MVQGVGLIQNTTYSEEVNHVQAEIRREAHII